MFFSRIFNKVYNFFLSQKFLFIAEEIFEFEKNNIMDYLATLKAIRKDKKSICRFGDGEIDMLLYPFLDKDWQEANIYLSKELEEIMIDYKGGGMVLCVPSANIHSLWWKRYWLINWCFFKFFLRKDIIYGNSFITRPECFELYKTEAVLHWKSIWEKKDVVFITGKNSRFQVDHVLFDNVESKEVIFSLSKNAFEDIDRIIFSINESYSNKLFLIALGQAGTILSYRLYKRGFWGLDIGHLDRSYDNFFLKKGKPESIKYT